MKKLEDVNNIPKPSIEEVESYLKKWHSLEHYDCQEKALNKLFFELCPDNKDISSILIKVATLNDFYSTNIYRIFDVAKHIESLNHIENKSSVDERLNNGNEDVSLVDDIKKVTMINKDNEEKEINFYSFATKYCSHHKPEYYPIYDKYVDVILRYFRREDNFYKFKNDDLKEYCQFKNIITQFMKFYKLDNYTFKEIDMYLWQLGKYYFGDEYTISSEI
ncbi:hypothetical protein PQQ32_02320 [Brachyspira hyodysenteriae]|uniref:hypothetical protein n=1 Tax=Brachyspira hyodysenteriae TaxID=159 RepID=UPI002B25B104|nr:hypothetical protein [Brachyspira hyodysenteriae]WPC38318.1 hypothetical protein PQQ32_02320 [Brachyspira hyodysenteriae]